MKVYLSHSLMLFLLLQLISAHASSPSADQLIKASVDKWRGKSSYNEMTMTIHRPKWERSISLRGWTMGESDSLIRVTAPKKDVGTATLTVTKGMWSYSPKINRVIKIPSSMMNQSWMGSDFSNNDVSKVDEIITDYNHKLLRTEQRNSHKIYVIESIPKEDAAIVWGKQIIVIRDDHIVLREEFYDQDGILVKYMDTLNIEIMDAQSVAQHQRMTDAEESNKWTEIRVDSVDFDIPLKESFFSLSNLRNPRN